MQVYSVIKFISIVLTLRIQFAFSVTSWIRTVEHNRQVGGADESLHLCGLGLDIVLDNPADTESFVKRANRLGLKALNEGDHIHLQPVG